MFVCLFLFVYFFVSQVSLVSVQETKLSKLENTKESETRSAHAQEIPGGLTVSVRQRI